MKKKILSIIGARPQFIKSAPLLASLSDKFQHKIVHTGQHYDFRMSKVFFDELGIPKPHYDLDVGSNSHGVQTGMMLAKLEEVFIKEKPAMVIVYGDTNSTLSGALAATKLKIKIAHVESGMRSFRLDMPEEVNRKVTDHLSYLHFCSSRQAMQWLKQEGITKRIFFTGDIMYDVLLKNIDAAVQTSRIIDTLELNSKKYILATIHRAENTDNKSNLSNILKAFRESKKTIVLPLHPRTHKMIKHYNLQKLLSSSNIKLTSPVGYLDMLMLEKESQKIVTDSGGIQKEAYYLKKPCITIRDETEWVETVSDGWNRLTGADTKKILAAIRSFNPKKKQSDVYGTGVAAKKIVQIMTRSL